MRLRTKALLVDGPLVSCPRNKHMFRRRSVGCFSRRERRAYLESIRKERATRKNSQLNTAQRVAMKMGRRLRCSSVTYPLRYAPSTASPARTALPAAHFDRNETYAYFGDRTLASSKSHFRDLFLKLWGIFHGFEDPVVESFDLFVGITD